MIVELCEIVPIQSAIATDGVAEATGVQETSDGVVDV